MRGQFFGWLTAIIFVMGLCAPVLLAQGSSAAEPVVLVVGRSTVIQAPWPTVRVAITDPKVADVQVLTPQQVLVQAFKVGTTDLILWSEGEKETLQRQVIVKLDIESIRNTLAGLFPYAELEVTESGEVLVVKGLVRSADEVTQLRDYLQKSKIPYVDMTSLSGVQQVQLQVRVAEVSRAAIRQLGFNAVHTGRNFFFGQKVGLVTPSIDIGPAAQTFLTPADFDNLIFASSEITSGSAVTFFGGFPKSNFEFFLKALMENQYLRLLATPTLVAQSGEEASFLAGGEFPIPVPQGGAGVGGQVTVTVEYKEFGVRLIFRPVVLGDNRIRLTSAQEVSELTLVGAVTLGQFTIPALNTRRAESTIELKSGQSFALAGLLRNVDIAVSSKLPGFGDLPVLGPLFRSQEYRNEETELVIFVTASLVEPMSTAKAPPLPGATHVTPDDWEFYLEGRLQGQGPALLDPSSAEWLKQMGLDQLAGPGAWDTYEGQDFNATMRTAEASGKAPAGVEKAAESK